MIEHEIPQDTWKQLAGNASAERVQDGMLVGLGTGSTAAYFVYALAQRIQNGLHIAGAIPSSQATRDLASSLDIPLTDLDTHPEIDLYVDGADEIDPQLHLLKGAGGALVREKIVATAAQSFIVIADITKQVPQLVHRFPIPVEVVPFGMTPTRKRLEALGATVTLRQLAGTIFITDNNNVVLDCTFPNGISDLDALQSAIKNIVGVVETGLFLHIAKEAIIGGPNGVKTFTVE
jgi:ribose 5-phosphate isomerase A